MEQDSHLMFFGFCATKYPPSWYVLVDNATGSKSDQIITALSRMAYANTMSQSLLYGVYT